MENANGVGNQSKNGESSQRERRRSRGNSLSFENSTPLSIAIQLIKSTQESSPVYISETLEKAILILQSLNICSENNQEVQNESTSVSTDLIGQLISEEPKQTIIRKRFSLTDENIPDPDKVDDVKLNEEEIERILSKHAHWNFDVLRLESLTEYRPLVWIGMKILPTFDIYKIYKTDETHLYNWLTLMEANYREENPYHNSTHAADVFHATAYYLNKQRLKIALSPIEALNCLIAAIIHDLNHPGKTNVFLKNADDELAVLYNDQSILESHHASQAFRLSLSDSRVDIYQGLLPDEYKSVRANIIDMVLSTDMTKHFEHTSKFSSLLSKTDLNKKVSSFESAEDLKSLRSMIIKCADVSNPTRPLKFSLEWAKRIANEYFDQTDKEIELHLPISMPYFKRDTCVVPKTQIGFIDLFIKDMFRMWHEFIGIPELIEELNQNYEFWKECDRNEIKTFDQIDTFLLTFNKTE